MSAPAYDVAVVGAGLLGAAVAWRLAEAGRRVAVLEAGMPASGATGNTFSWLNAVSKEPEAYHRLNAAGAREYEAVADLLGATVVHRGGCIEWAAGGEAEDELAERLERLQARGYPARWIGPGEVRALEPALRLGDTARVAFYERDAWVDAPEVARGLLGRAKALGAALHPNHPVTALERAGDDTVAVRLDEERISAGAVVLCAGTATPALVRMLGVEVPVARRPGLLAVTSPVPPGTLARVVYAPGVHFRPDVSGGLRLGADDVDALTRADTPPDPPPPWAAILLRRATAVLRLPADISIRRVHIGIRPVPADGLTVAGRLPGWDNVYVAVTHSGITLGPLLGRLLAEEITSGERSPLLVPFRPDRFAAPA